MGSFFWDLILLSWGWVHNAGEILMHFCLSRDRCFSVVAVQPGNLVFLARNLRQVAWIWIGITPVGTLVVLQITWPEYFQCLFCFVSPLPLPFFSLFGWWFFFLMLPSFHCFLFELPFPLCFWATQHHGWKLSGTSRLCGKLQFGSIWHSCIFPGNWWSSRGSSDRLSKYG